MDDGSQIAADLNASDVAPAGYVQVQAHYHAHKLSLAGLEESAIARSLASARVEMNPHQVDAALFALKSPLSKGVLLADEVGLGKTIEAGLVIAQRWAEHRRSILLVVPASLRKQWEQELWEKFSIPSRILEAATYRSARENGLKRPFDDGSSVVISSYEFAASKAEAVEHVPWDLVVFDEAHRLRNVYRKNGSARARELKSALSSPFKILLTATPLQNTLMELYGIISVIDDTHFGGENAFRSQYFGTAATKASLAGLRDRLQPLCHRTLRRQVQEAGHINFRSRHAVTFDFEPGRLELELYDRLSEFLQRRDTVAYGERANQLVVLQVRKIMGSSTFAVVQYLEKLLERLKSRQSVTLDMTDDVEEMDELADEWDGDGAEAEEASIDPLRLATEIVEVEGLLKLARSIEVNAKGEMLIDKLPRVLDEIEAKGGARKAVVFTESVRTQTYLAQLMAERGYRGQIVLLNGSNGDPVSREILSRWQERHRGTDKVSTSRSANMKAAIVEAFREDGKTVMIATESGAEGINLQFCSLVVNYDLPWNPQRVEQRIGRCHRYGQRIDVSVVNMLNSKNQTEQRIHELLSQKFHLFDGVFGASDEVLGTLVSGLDFEREVLRIVQECRTEEEAEREFEALKAGIQDRIDADMESARAKVLEHMDGEVVEKLHHRQRSITSSVEDVERRLLMVAQAGLLGIRLARSSPTAFEHGGRWWSVRWKEAEENGWTFFRANEGEGRRLVSEAEGRDMSQAAQCLVLRPSRYPFPGRLSVVEELAGRSGWMRVWRVSQPGAGSLREELLVACADDGGERIKPEIADRMLWSPAEEDPSGWMPPPAALLENMEADLFGAFSQKVRQQNFRWLEEESERLDRYARDVEIEVDAQIAEIEGEVKELNRRKRSPELSMEEKLAIGREVRPLEERMDDLKLSKFERRKQARHDKERRLDEFEESLARAPSRRLLFTLRWRVA